MTVLDNSGFLPYEIENKAAEYGIDAKIVISHDGSRAYQLKVVQEMIIRESCKTDL